MRKLIFDQEDVGFFNERFPVRADVNNMELPLIPNHSARTLWAKRKISGSDGGLIQSKFRLPLMGLSTNGYRESPATPCFVAILGIFFE